MDLRPYRAPHLPRPKKQAPGNEPFDAGYVPHDPDLGKDLSLLATDDDYVVTDEDGKTAVSFEG